MKTCKLVKISMIVLICLCHITCDSDSNSDLVTGELHVVISDENWNGILIPNGQQCDAFEGSNQYSPILSVSSIPKSANVLVLEFNDESYTPMDNGGHGKVAFWIKLGVGFVTVPGIPGHSFDLPENFELVQQHLAAGFYTAGAYLPPCSGGINNLYSITVKAQYVEGDMYYLSDTLAETTIHMGRY